MTTLMEFLESLNRKERFFLIGDALGNRTFQLSADYQSRLGEALDISIPDGAFVAMDYHLDWIHASLFLTQPGVDREGFHPNIEPVATGNQEDADLLVAFEKEGLTHLVLVEAKAETGWTNMQEQIEGYLTIAQGVSRTGLSRYWIWKLLKEHRIEGRRLGSIWLVSVESLDHYMLTKERPGGYRRRVNNS